MKKLFILLLPILSFIGCDHEIFSPTFTVEALCDSNGYVTPTKLTVEKGDSVKFTVFPNERCFVSKVTLNEIDITEKVDSNSFVIRDIKSNSLIKVLIKVIPLKDFVITAYSGPNGSISPSGEMTLKENTSQIFNMAPVNIGFEMDVLKVNDVVAPNTSSYTFNNISSNNKIDVTWKKDSIFYPLLNYTWYEVKSEAFLNGEWIVFNTYPHTFNFFQDGSTIELWNGKLYAETWAVDKNTSPATFKMFNFNWKIESISEKEIILSRINFDGIPMRDTFKSGPKITLKI